MIDQRLISQLEAIGPVRLNEPLSRHTTFGVGGPADAFFIARSAAELRQAILACRSLGASYFVLGSGSNLLVSDAGIRGVVIANRATNVGQPVPDPDNDSFLLTADSGANLPAIARDMAQRGLAGLEWACGIPGTVGGAVYYNAGAFGGWIAGPIVSALVLNGSANEKTVDNTALALDYRHSALRGGPLEGAVVLSATFRLHTAPVDDLTHKIAHYDQRRRANQPPGRSAGSFFQNPPDHHAWKLIRDAGLCGHRIGDALVSETHANFLLNVGNATAADVKALSDLIRRRVREQTGIDLQPEVTFVGEGFDD